MRAHCDRCGVNVYGDNSAHVVFIGEWRIFYCADCWPNVRRRLRTLIGGA